MKEYKYKIETKMFNHIMYDVVIPEKHSCIQELVCETIDLNANDSYANITNYHTLCMVLKKGKNQWDTIYNGESSNFELNGLKMMGKGVYAVLFQLENKKVRDNYDRKIQIKELKQRIHKDSIRLRKLEKNKKEKPENVYINSNGRINKE